MRGLILPSEQKACFLGFRFSLRFCPTPVFVGALTSSTVREVVVLSCLLSSVSRSVRRLRSSILSVSLNQEYRNDLNTWKLSGSRSRM